MEGGNLLNTITLPWGCIECICFSYNLVHNFPLCSGDLVIIICHISIGIQYNLTHEC